MIGLKLSMALLGFVIWPLLPDRFIDRWQLIQPREYWLTVVIIACLGFLNYVLLRVYGGFSGTSAGDI